MLQLIESIPPHIVEEDGIFYARELTTREERVPQRFSASVLVEGAEGLSWHALVTGLETDRSRMRSRLEDALETANARQRARLSTALSACYSGLFGFRRPVGASGLSAFDAWVATLPIKPDREPIREEDAQNEPPRIKGRGCTLMPFSPETGHVPVGHDLLLYLLAEVETALATADFSDVAQFEASEAPDNAPSPYTLQAWHGGRVYEAAAHAYGDFYDAAGVVAFLNGILRAVGSDNRYRILMEGECIGHGPHDAIAELDDDDI